ncbi:MAG: hypothetical protein ACR2MO_12975 [Acidimicrobiales bacterium]
MRDLRHPRRTGRPPVAAVAALLALFAFAPPLSAPALGATAGSGVTAAGEPLAAARAVLDARTEAVRRKDRAAFLATVDPRAPAAFREAQARQFEGLRSLPLASFALRASIDDTGDLGTGLAGRYGGAKVFLPETRQVYRLEGYDDRDAVDHLWLTFVQRDGAWYVGGDADLEAVGLETDRQLWDSGPVRLVRTEHVLVLSHPEQAERAAALAAIAEEAAVAFAARWDQPWSGRVPVILPSSVDELERLLESTVDLDKFVAFAGYGVEDDETGWATTAPRVFVQDARLDRYSRPAQVETLVHELVHFASAPLSGPFVPAWVHEGVADWVATGRPTGERRPSGGDARLPRDFEMSTGSSASIVRAYRESRAAVSLLAGRRGAGAPSAFFVRLGAVRVAPGSADHNVDASLRAAENLSLGELEAAWADRRD